MSFAQGARNRLAIKAQADYLTQATANGWLEVPYTTHSLNLSKQEIESNTQRADREVSDVRHGQRNAAGQIACELRYADAAMELLMQSAMFNPFASNEVQIGTTRTFLSAEDWGVDVSRGRLFTGLEATRMAVSIRPNQMATVTFDMAGRDMATLSAVASGTTPTAPTTNGPMDSFSGAIYDAIPMSGAELNIVTSLDFQVDNGIQATSVVGDSRAPFQEFGRGRVTGTVTVYYRDNIWIDRFLNETEVPLLCQVADALGNDYIYYFPRVKYNGADAPVQNEQSRTITLPFRALKPTSGSITSALRIQK